MRISDWSSDVCTSDLRCIANASERPVEQEDDQHETGRNHQHQPLAGRLEILELTTPIEIMAGRKAHLPVDRLPRIGDDTGNVASTHIGLNHDAPLAVRSEEHTSELQSLMRISY